MLATAFVDILELETTLAEVTSKFIETSDLL